MTSLIRDISQPKENAALVNDVQLHWFYSDERRNLQLTSDYIWTHKSLSGYVSSLELLHKLKESFLWPQGENRYVVIATYGHGKSHLALALANFFGKAADSAEVNNLFNSISHASESQAQNFKDFKRGNGINLVLCLRGDQPQGIHQQLVKGLEVALASHGLNARKVLPFWFLAAEQFLSSLAGEAKQVANEFLNKSNLDLTLLIEKVRARDDHCYELCRKVHLQVYNTMPDFGAQMGLQEIVEHTVSELCGEDKPFSGLLILFDEFSAFVSRYAKQDSTSYTSSLQDLLNGVSNCRGKAVFIAFAQQDPDQVAKNAFVRMGLSGNPSEVTLLTELNRLPHRNRYPLYSSLEIVLDAYLKQDDKAWGKLLDNTRAMKAIEDATDYVIRIFPERYEENMGWGIEKVQEQLTKGCFPLHPITVALLASVQLQERGAQARSVLGSVLEEWNRRKDEPALKDGVPSWIYPITLVDWFEDMLADREWEQYKDTVQQVGPDAPEVQKSILKSLLLYVVGQIRKGRTDKFEKIISLLSGYSAQECQAGLESLADSGYIRRDENRGVYTFWESARRGREVERKLSLQVSDMQLDFDALLELNRKWEAHRLKPIPVSIEWGNQDDWSAAQMLLTRGLFTPENLRSIVAKVKLNRKNELEDARKGYVIWAIAESDLDIDWFRTQAAGIVDEALGIDPPPPAIIALPQVPQPHLIRQILRERALEKWTTEEKRDAGEALNDLQSRTSTEIKKELTQLQKLDQFIVPQPYRAQVQASIGNDTLVRIDRALKLCYKQAYRLPAFFTQYKQASAPLKTAVNLLARLLATNSLASNRQAILSNKPATDLLNKFMQEEWGIVDDTLRIRQPQKTNIKEAWKLLNNTFASGKGEVPVRNVLLKLSNPTFGYDVNQLTLLFCAWCGLNSHDLQVSLRGKLTGFENLLSSTSRPKDFLNELLSGDMRLLRRDPGELRAVAVALIEMVNHNHFSVSEAEDAHQKLLDFKADEREELNLRNAAENAAKLLQQNLGIASTYASAVDKIQQELDAARNVKDVSRFLKAIEQLPQLGIVIPDKPKPADLRERANKVTGGVLAEECKKFEKLNQLTDYSNYREKLLSLKKTLGGAARQEWITTIEESLARLEESKALLESEGKDAVILNRLESIRHETRLAQLIKASGELPSFRPHSIKAQTDLQQTIDQVAAAIKKAKDYVRNLISRVERISSSNESRQLRDEIQRVFDRYSGTDELHQLEAAVIRCGLVEDFYQKVSIIEQANISNLQDVERITRDIERLKLNRESPLSETQERKIQELGATVQRKVDSKKEEGKKWLASVEKRAHSNNIRELIALQAELRQPGDFLSEDDSERIEAIKRTIASRIDENDVERAAELLRAMIKRSNREEGLRKLHLIQTRLDELIRELSAS